MKIRQRFVKTLTIPKEKTLYWDDEIRGFGISATPGGAISFVLNYRIAGRERRFVIGRFPEWSADAARQEALDLRHEISKGNDPLAAREAAQDEPTLGDLAKDYIVLHAEKKKRASSLRNDRQMLDNIILPKLKHLRVGAVDRRDIERLHGSLKSTPYRANRVLALLSTMFGLAIAWKLRDDNPAKGIKRYDEPEREKFLPLEQVAALETALRAYPNQEAANAIRLLICTGAREMEVLQAEWSQFDLKRGVWTKPSHHTKQRKTEHVPLNQAAWEILLKMHKQSKGRYLFPGENGGSRVTIRRPWVQVCKAAGLAEEYREPGRRKILTKYRPTVRIHDLRHTFASHLVIHGESLHKVGKLLGHTNPSTTQRYAHLSDESLRAATNAVQLLKGAE
jgi:integrase